MKKQEKIFYIEDLAERLKEAKIVVLADYQGLTSIQMSQLRNLVKQAGGQVLVVKNTLLKLAAQKTGLPRQFTEGEFLRGPTALVLATEDEVAPVKAIYDFKKTAGLPSFKSALWEDRILSADEIERLGSLPGREQLIGKLVNLFSAPTYRLVDTLSNNPQKLILILKGIKKDSM